MRVPIELARGFQTLVHMLRFTPMEELSSLKSETVDQGVIDSAGHAYPQPVLNVFFKSLYATKDLKCLDNNVYK